MKAILADSIPMALTTNNLNNLTPDDLVSLLLGTGVTVSNIKVTQEGRNDINGSFDSYQAIGTFSGGFSEDLGLDSGVILSTGNINDISGPNDSDSTGQGLGTPGDPDLDLILNPDLANESEDREEPPEGDTNDAIAIEFDFVPEHEEFVFEYVFASDEYNEFANSAFNDIFAFLLDGENIALIPGTTIPVSINNINAGENEDFFRNNDLDDVGVQDILPTEFDGLTTVLGVRGFVTPGKTHHLKLVIADTGDSAYDSAVFLKAGSLSTPPIIPDATLAVNERDIVTIGGSVTPALAKLKFTLSGTNTDSIKEVGVFEVDDDFGSINGVFPGEDEYEQLALTRITSRSIFTGLSGSLMDGQDLSRLINYNVGSKLGFYLISGGTSDMVLSNTPLYFLDPTPEVLFGFPEANSNFQDPLRITNNGNSLTLSWDDDFPNNGYDDLVLNVEVVDPSTVPDFALSSRRQGDVQKEIIDLSILEKGETATANVKVWSESVNHNHVGLYRLEDGQGTVFDPLTEETLTPEQNGYLEAAIRQRVFEFDSKNGGNIELEKGYYAPYMIVGGSAAEWLNSNANNFYAGDTFAYVPSVEASTSIQLNYDRITLLADNVFGFEEDLISDSDLDFNDMVMMVDFLQINENPRVNSEIALTIDPNDDSLFNIPLNRFQNSNLPGAYLFATPGESQTILDDFPSFVPEGTAFNVANKPGDNLMAINRFQNSNLPGTYLFAGEVESQSIRENFPNFVDEGRAFYVYPGEANIGVDVYRFHNQDLPGTYIFVTGGERQNILNNFPNFVEEGVAFEVGI